MKNIEKYEIEKKRRPIIGIALAIPLHCLVCKSNYFIPMQLHRDSKVIGIIMNLQLIPGRHGDACED